jgi:hypothetical protein
MTLDKEALEIALSHFEMRDFKLAEAAILAYLSALPPARSMDGWQAIETAPKDGTPIELYRPPTDDGSDSTWQSRVIAMWFDDNWVWPDEPTLGWPDVADTSWLDEGDFWEASDGFTHWRPLPAAPTPPVEGEK